MSTQHSASSLTTRQPLPERYRIIGAIESHRFIVEHEIKQLTHYQGVALQGPECAVVAPDVGEIDHCVHTLFIDITSNTFISRCLYEYLRTLLTGQAKEAGQVYCYTLERAVSYTGSYQHTCTVLTVYPLHIVQMGDGTYIEERKPRPQTDEAYMIFDLYSAHPYAATVLY
jgi:hypothetical protein